LAGRLYFWAASAEPRKRFETTHKRQVLGSGYGIEVDGLLKSEFVTIEGATNGARELKTRFSMLQIRIYDVVTKTRTEVTATDPVAGSPERKRQEFEDFLVLQVGVGSAVSASLARQIENAVFRGAVRPHHRRREHGGCISRDNRVDPPCAVSLPPHRCNLPRGVWLKGRHEDLFDIGEEGIAAHRAIDDACPAVSPRSGGESPHGLGRSQARHDCMSTKMLRFHPVGS